MIDENKIEALYKIINLIDYLGEEDLMQLNRKIVERLRIIGKVKSLKSMSGFNTLDKVYFIKDGIKKTGTIIRLNQKTVTILTEDGGHWNVSPNFLTKIIEV